MTIARRVANRFAKTKAYKVDRGSVQRQLRNLNDAKDRADSMRDFGGYAEYQFELVPLHDITIPPVWNPPRIKSVLEGIDAGKALPPVNLERPSPGAKWAIGDGIHRTNASVERGFSHVPAITSRWVDTPDAVVKPAPAKPKLEPGTWIKLNRPLDGFSFGWIERHVSANSGASFKEHAYEVALVKPASTWPDFVDLRDSLFEPTETPPWGPETKARCQ